MSTTRPPARVASGTDQRVHERRALALVAAGREGLLELVDGEHEPPVGSRRGGRVVQRAQRMLARAQQRDRPALAAGQDALAQRRQQAGAQRRDLPLPDGPTIPSSGAPARRATISATSRSRPKKNAASSGSNAARPLNGQTTTSAGDPRSLARGLQRDDDVARELVLGRAQPGAARRRAPGGTAQAADALGPRPLDRGLVDLARHAAAVLHQAGDRHLHVLARVRVEARDGGHVVGVERPEHDRRIDARHREPRRRPAPWRATSTGSAPRPSTSSRRAAPTSSPARSTSSTTSSVGRRARAAREIAARPAAGSPAPEAWSTMARSRCTSPASSAASRVLPMPRAPSTSTKRAASGVRVAPRLAQHVELGLAARRAACPRRARPAAARFERRQVELRDPGAGSRRAARAARVRARRRSARRAPIAPAGRPRSASAWRPER